MRFYLFLISFFLIFSTQSRPEQIMLDNQNCLLCHKYPGLSRVTDDGYLRLFYIDYSNYSHSVHEKVKCTGCHSDINELPHKNVKKVDCTSDCHIKYPNSEIPFSHKNILKDFENSVHNSNNKYVNNKDVNDFPTCTDCHNNTIYRNIISEEKEHQPFLQNAYRKCSVCHKDEGFYKYFFNHVTNRLLRAKSNESIVKTCSKCHSNNLMAKKHNLKNASATYLDTFHGKAVGFGFGSAPTCIDCHTRRDSSAHSIFSVKDPKSSVYKENRYKACVSSNCHPTVTKSFGDIRMHVVIDKELYPAEYYTALGFTGLTIGAFFPLLILLILELIREIFPNFTITKDKEEDQDDN